MNIIFVVSKSVDMETTYTEKQFTIGKTKWGILIVEGKRNYISVTKLSNNPFRTLGKEFKSFDEAVSHYKNPTMKLELTKIELGI